MNELVKLGEKTYVLKSITNIGFYNYENNDVIMIDSGANQKGVDKIIDVIKENNFNLKYIINTHAHADHIYGNKMLKDKFSAIIFANTEELPFIKNTLLNSCLFYGSNPPKELINDMICAQNSDVTDINYLNIPGIEIYDLSGHTIGMIGVKTSDDVFFVGDAYANPKVLKKYPLQYLFDVKKYLDTLNFINKFDSNYYVSSHDEIREDVKDVINENIENVNGIIKYLINSIGDKIFYEDLIAKIFLENHIPMNINQYYLISNTIKAYLTFFNQNGIIEFAFEDNKMIIKKVS